MSEGLFFPQQVGGSGGGSDSQYVEDSFDDYTLPATTNVGLSSTISTNPSGDYFGNDLAAKYSTKTLYIKDLVLEEDRSKWINAGRTYRVIWTENFPGINAYVVGSPQLNKDLNGTNITISSSGSGVLPGGECFAVSGQFLKASFLVKPQTTTAPVDIGTDNGVPVRVNAGGYNGELGNTGTSFIYAQRKFFVLDDGAALLSNNLHTVTVAGTPVQIFGVVVYLSANSNSVQVHPGSFFVEKAPVTAAFGASITLPAQNASLFHLGAKTTFVEDLGGNLGATTYPIPLLQTIATGLSGTNQLAVLATTGASFSQGAGVNIQTGTSIYLGFVRSVAGDVLTVSPTLPYAMTNATLTRAFSYLPALVAGDPRSNSLNSNYELAYSWNPVTSYGASNWNGSSAMYVVNGPSQVVVQGGVAYNTFYDPQNRFAVIPFALATGVTGQQGRMRLVNNIGAFSAGWAGPLTIKGDFQAIEFEMNGGGEDYRGIFSVDGISMTPGVSIRFEDAGTTLSGQCKIPVVQNLGVGFHTLKYDTSISNAVITRINFYKNKGVSLAGAIYSLEQNQTQYDTANAFATPIGAFEYFGADKLTYSGGFWLNSAQSAIAASLSQFPAFARVVGLTTASVMTFKYWGKNFTLFTDSAGGSFTTTLDGGAINPVSGQMNTVATETLHTLQVTWASGTFGIQGVAIMKDYRELKSLQGESPATEPISGSRLVDRSVGVAKAHYRTKNTNSSMGNALLTAPLGGASYFITATGTSTTWFDLGTIQTNGNPVLLGLNANYKGSTTGGLTEGYTTPLIALSQPATGNTLGLFGGIIVSRFPIGGSAALNGTDPGGVQVNSIVNTMNFGARIGTTTGFVVGHQLTYPAPFSVVDFAPAGTWTYRLGLQPLGASNTIGVYNAQFFAMEMF